MAEIKVALLCGGPSRERGISLNSARSFLDHTRQLSIKLFIFYLHPTGYFYELSPADLYSNTPSDFDFKLASKKTSFTEEMFIQELKKVDLVFPLIHGAYGEDGTLQKRLEEQGILFTGSPGAVCERMFNKYKAHKWLKEHGFETLPALYITRPEQNLLSFWEEHRLCKAVIKPTMSGSSIGVHIVDSLESAKKALHLLWTEGFREFLLEPYSEDREFTICVLEHRGSAVPLIPLEIDIQKQGILDYRKKYLPSLETRHYCPPRFSKEEIHHIRNESAKLFQLFQIQGCARLDGWLKSDGTIRFSDFNPVSGMEQNSFLFQQGARVGLSHTDLIEYLLKETLHKAKKPALQRALGKQSRQKQVYVLMGGDTSERQVSLLSGTNVWLKLQQSDRYHPVPFLLDTEGTVWQLPYDFALHHTVEEMAEHCKRAKELIDMIDPLIREIRDRLALPPLPNKEAPKPFSLRAFYALAKRKNAFVFLGLHGGKGEDGTIQKELEKKGIPFNGSDAKGSKLCMDKRQTAKRIEKLQNPFILAMPQVAFEIDQLPTGKHLFLWDEAVKRFKTDQLIVKPQKDGCSTGVVRLKDASELGRYIDLLLQGQPKVSAHFFHYHPSVIELPTSEQKAFLLEPFIQTDKIYAKATTITHEKISGWCEMTIAVLEKAGIYRALNPSLTLAANDILSVEEKFQGGTGINITPPPGKILSLAMRKLVKLRVCDAAKALGIRGYARLDLFVECKTGKIRVIEANTLPALTPSTVFYHQALAETPPISPQMLLTEIIESGRAYS